MMDNIQFFSMMATIIGSVGSGVIFLYKEIKSFESKSENQSARIDKLYEISTERSDKLYQMFIDLRKENDEKFYALLKEKKQK